MINLWITDPFVLNYTHEPYILNIPYIPDPGPVFPKNWNSDPNPKNLAGLQIRAHLWLLAKLKIVAYRLIFDFLASPADKLWY